MVNKKCNICGDPDLYRRFEAKSRQFFDAFDSLIVLTIYSDSYISRSGDFIADNDDNDALEHIPHVHHGDILMAVLYT